MNFPEIPMMAHHEAVKIEELLTKYDCKRCLEWGSGASTVRFPKIESIEEWVSMEHDQIWFNELRKHGYPSKVQLVLAPLPFYIQYPKGVFDFILVDGIERIKCIQRIAKDGLLSPKGIVVLHDAGRLRYATARDYFTYMVEFIPSVGVAKDGGPDFNGITIFTNNEHIYNRECV